MNRRITRTTGRFVRIALLCAAAAGMIGTMLAARLSSVNAQAHSDDLVAHEWGTFTSVAGSNGHALDWLPFTRSVDAPDFVHRDLLPISGLPGFVYHAQQSLKFGLRGTIRMETPVLYFYSNRDQAVSVHVSFARGLITEWYPGASSVTPTDHANGDTLYTKKENGSLAWDHVVLEPGSSAEFMRADAANRYFAARNTSSTPLRVRTAKGEEHEKFLFYRGVSAAPAPISAISTDHGEVKIRSLVKEAVPSMVLFERRAERLGYRVVIGLQAETVLDPPELTASIDSLTRDLEEMLVMRGLYRDEAQAMLKTWEDSWFEEGSRLIYIVPSSYVDTILPLSIQPVPAQTVRVFVGRVELISPATQLAVKNAMLSRDTATLRKYCRFMEPILRAINGSSWDESFSGACW